MPNSHGQETPSRETPCRPATSHGSASTDRSVNAAAPRTAAPSPNSDTSTSQPDQPAAEDAPAEGVTDLVDEPRRERPEAPAEHDGVDVEQVHRGRETDTEVAARLGEALDDRRVALLGAPDELPRHVARSAMVVLADAGPARDRLLADDRLEAADRAALASKPIGIDGDVTELGAEAVRPAEQVAADEDPGAHADLDEHADEVVLAARDTLPVLGESGEVRLVVGTDGDSVQTRGDLVRYRNLRPPQVRCAE